MRNVYFSFHYEDIWKVNQIRKSGVVFGAKSAGFADRSLWEEAKAKHDRALKELIADGLNGTSVTVVLIGRETASRRWVKYEIQQSLKRGNALLGIHIHQVPTMDGRVAHRGRVPHALKAHDSLVHDWTDVQDFRQWVDDAWQVQNRKPSFLERLFG
jgi:hypothetical protein